MENWQKKEGRIMKVAHRYHVLSMAVQGLTTSKEGAQALNVSERHFKRLKKKFRKSGPKALIHGNCGRSPHNAYPQELKQKVLHLFRSQYQDFNLSHFTDTLKEEHGIAISRETVRSWLIEAKLYKPKAQKYRRRKRRPRSKKEGEIVFLDGSIEVWFGQEKYTLLLALDDATGKALSGLFVPRETVKDYFRLCYNLFLRYGLPLRFYLDRHSIFLTTRHEGVHVKQSAEKPTAFQTAMAELDIGLIYARSPQARGRIERSFRTFQDRLRKELAAKGIHTPEEANRYLQEIFIPRYNRRFAVEAEDKDPAWRKPPANLKEILSRRMERKVKGDFTISVEGKILQLKPPRLTMRLSGVKVEVRELFDGSFRIYHPEGGIIPYEELGRPKKACRKTKLRLKKIWEGVTFSPCS